MPPPIQVEREGRAPPLLVSAPYFFVLGVREVAILRVGCRIAAIGEEIHGINVVEKVHS